MCLIRISKVIRKNDLDLYINDPSISKISIVRRKNNLRDSNALKIDIFILVDKQRFFNLIDQAKVIAKNHKIGNGVNSFLNGLGNAKNCGFISKGDIEKLKLIEINYNLNLSIPNHYFDLINKYK